jgi:hypothetical protein
MAQGDFTKQEVKFVREAVQEIWEALTIKKREDFFGHLNDIFLFLDAADAVAPDEVAIQE